MMTLTDIENHTISQQVEDEAIAPWKEGSRLVPMTYDPATGSGGESRRAIIFSCHNPYHLLRMVTAW